MYRLVPVIALLAALALPFAGRARAYETWCFDDPVIAVGGRLLDIQVQMPVDNLLTMRSTRLTVVIPSNVSGAVLVDDVSAFPMQTVVSPTGPTWNGAGALPITITAAVAAAAVYPIRLAATPLAALGSPLAGPATAMGTANTPLSMPFALER